MKRLISIIAVFAMMLSMATVSFAALNAGEEFEISVGSAEVQEGSTDTFTIRVDFTVVSDSQAANGVSVCNFNLNFDPEVITYVSATPSSDLDASAFVDPAGTQYNGSNGALMLKYSLATATPVGKINSDSYYDITFRLADDAVAGDSTTFTMTAGSNVASINSTLKSVLNWVPKASMPNYFVGGTVTVTSATPPAPLDPVITPDSGEAGEEGTTVVWGTAANVTPVANGKDDEGHDIYTYTTEAGDPAEFGVQITSGDFAGYYPALGLKDGKFAIKFIGNAAADLLTQLYLKIDGVLQDLN